jgi:LemA protein
MQNTSATVLAETTNFGILGQYTNFLFWTGWILAILAIYIVITYNSIIQIKNKVKESFSSIDTVLQNRYNLIPNLIEVVKQYATHETSLLNNVSEMRSKLLSNTDKGSVERFNQENQLQAGIKSIFAIAESYPDLKASNNYLELQTQWSEIEDRLQAARRAYNSSVKLLNDKKEMFPSNIVASMMTIENFAMFQAEEGAKVEKMDAKELFK